MKSAATILTLLFLFSNTVLFAQQSTIARGPFKGENVPGSAAAPDYYNLKFWAAHPLKKDAADRIPAGLNNERVDTSVDVFYLHPTTFTGDFANAAFTANVNNETLNDLTDSRAILNQASIFNASGRVYAPRYRQAHLKSFYLFMNPQAKVALDLAYDDLKASFEYYLKHYNNGRPIIIAGHSQGAYHGIRLLKEYFDGKPLQKQLVCAYLVGWQIKKDEFKSIPFGTTPDETGCVVGWRSHKNGTIDAITERENGGSLCVNPVTWTTDNNWSDIKSHKGILGSNFKIVAPSATAVKIDERTNVLWVNLPESLNEGLVRSNNLHVADFNLFYVNVRENVKQRVKAFLAKH